MTQEAGQVSKPFPERQLLLLWIADNAPLESIELEST